MKGLILVVQISWVQFIVLRFYVFISSVKFEVFRVPIIDARDRSTSSTITQHDITTDSLNDEEFSLACTPAPFLDDDNDGMITNEHDVNDNECVVRHRWRQIVCVLCASFFLYVADRKRQCE